MITGGVSDTVLRFDVAAGMWTVQAQMDMPCAVINHGMACE